MTLAAGTAVTSRYTIERFLAAGGMGAVYVARDAAMDAPVALKLSFARPEDADLRARFAREARIAHRLGRHPGIVRALDWGEAPAANALFLVLDLVPDARPLDLVRGSLEERLGRLLEAVRIVARVHAAGVVHRDLKPENFLADATGAVWLSDFGLAKLEGESDLVGSEPTGGLTASNVGFGTPRYMSPEQLEDAKRVDARTDVYALGVMLFFALTGHHPYAASTVPNLLAQHARVRDRRAAAPRPRDHDPSIPPALDELAASATALERSARTASAEALARELERWLGVVAPTLPEPVPAPGPERVVRGSPVAALTFRLGVVPILAGREWLDDGAFVAVEEWERWLVSRRHPGAALDVARLAARKADRGPLRLPLHEPFTRSILAELGATGARWRAWCVHVAGAWAVVVRTLPAAIPEDLASWETVPEPEGGLWSAPVAHDGVELREALARLRASDLIAREPVVAYRDLLEALGRLSPPAEVIGPAIPEAYCGGCSLGSFHGLLAPLARGEVDAGSGPELVLRGRSGDVRLAASDLRGAWRCPLCGGDRVRLRFAHAWDEQRGSIRACEVVVGDRRAVSGADPIATAARLVAERRGLVVVVSTRRPELDAVAARLRGLGLPAERIVRRSPAGLDREAAFAAGEADCLLLEVGAGGPGALSFAGFQGEIQVVVTSAATLPASALEAIERAIDARRPGR